jgi:hypothetical protein
MTVIISMPFHYATAALCTWLSALYQVGDRLVNLQRRFFRSAHPSPQLLACRAERTREMRFAAEVVHSLPDKVPRKSLSNHGLSNRRALDDAIVGKFLTGLSDQFNRYVIDSKTTV